jgi:2-oxoglutarate ferredoxin oxidoreductase subunit beta
VDDLSTTTPHGNIEPPFDLCRLAIGAGAPFVARWTMGFPYETIAAVESAIRTEGFGFVEILAPCPTGYGKANELSDAPANWDWYKKNTITRMDLAALPPEERAANDKIVVGTLWQEDKPEFCASWQGLVERLQSESEPSE